MRVLPILLAILLTFTVCPAKAEDAVARGRYLAILGDCAGCHTHVNGPAYAGGLPFSAQFGTVYSSNITPDPQTGIGGWSADQFYRALHEGVTPDGRHLYPAFPYPYFIRITRQDTDDLFAYLKTLKPVRQTPTPNKLIFPFNIRALMVFWNWFYLDRAQPASDPAQTITWQRGEYLVNGLGHCAACHTPKDILFGDIKSKELTGGVVDGWYSANLTGGDVDGLGKWKEDDVVQYLATGRNQFATAAGSMQEKVTSSTSHMNSADRLAIATYLKSLKPQRLAASKAPNMMQMHAGEAVFVARCAVCHQPPRKPDVSGSTSPLPNYPELANDTLVLGRDPTTVLRIILQGADSPLTPNEATNYSMPAFPVLSDQQVADAATYVRNSWGNHAPPVTADQVKALRTVPGP